MTINGNIRSTYRDSVTMKGGRHFDNGNKRSTYRRCCITMKEGLILTINGNVRSTYRDSITMKGGLILTMGI